MIHAFAALLLAGLAPPATPPPATSPPITVTAPPPDPDEVAKTVAQMQDMYDQGCASREYGAYDDVCDELRQQLKAAQAQAAREARRAKKAKAAAPP